MQIEDRTPVDSLPDSDQVPTYTGGRNKRRGEQPDQACTRSRAARGLQGRESFGRRFDRGRCGAGRRAAGILRPPVAQPVEEWAGFIRGGAPVDGGPQQPRRLRGLAAVERGDAGVQQLFRFAKLLGERAAGTVDVGSRPGMAPIEKQHPRPDVDRLFVPCREVMVQPGKQQLFDLRIAIGIGHAVERA